MEWPKFQNPKEIAGKAVRVLPLIPFLLLLTQIPASGAPLGQTEVTRGNPEKGIALTYDCGPWVDRGYINSILDVLDERGIKVTFFVTGEFIRKNPDDFLRIIQSGHEIANHSNTHPDFNSLSDSAIRTELAETERKASEYGVSTKPLWRAPFGARSSRVREVAAGEGYDTNVMWALDSGDWVAGISGAQVQRNLLRAQAGDIVVDHCNTPFASVYANAIDIYHAQGIRVVPVSELIN